MNEQTITQDRLAEEIDALLAPYPDPMSRNAFRIACHIGTRTSLYLLQSGLVPCIPHRQARPLLQDRQGGRGRLPAPPSDRTGALCSSQRVVQELSPAQAACRIPDSHSRLRDRQPPAPPPPSGAAAGRRPRRADRRADRPLYRLHTPHRQPLVHRGPPARHPAPPTVYGTENVAAGLLGFG